MTPLRWIYKHQKMLTKKRKGRIPKISADSYQELESSERVPLLNAKALKSKVHQPKGRS
jgi:hypothetical protein